MKILLCIILLIVALIGYKFKISFLRKKYVVIILCLISGICIFGSWSKKLTIVVPKGYVGEVCLIRSNVKENILKIDSNGIGYITEEAFEHTILEPTVIEVDGTNINDRVVGFSPSAFWATGKFSNASTDTSVRSKTIQFLSFEIVPKGMGSQMPYYTTDFMKFVDTTKVLWK